MKTIKYFSILSLLLIFTGITAVYSVSRQTSSNSGRVIRPTINYEVRIHLTDKGSSLCNTYLVQVTDENGVPVAHAQQYVPGTDLYVFNEVFTQSAKARIASLVLLSNVSNESCPDNLSTKSSVMTGPFVPGQTYIFDLFPGIIVGGN